MSNEIQKTNNGLQMFNQAITNPKWQDYLQQVLGDRKASFVNNIIALVANNKALQECVPATLIYAAIKATALNLALDQNLGYAYVIPYKNSKEGIIEAQFQLGYKGFIQLALRSGQFKVINSTDVREGELIKRDYLTGKIIFDWCENDTNRLNKKIIGYVSFFELSNGYKSTLYMSVLELEQHGLKYSQTYKNSNSYVKNNSKWVTDFDAMAKKTVLKLNLNKNAPLSVEMQNAILVDQAVIGDNEKLKYVDNNQQLVIDEKQATDIGRKLGADIGIAETPFEEINETIITPNTTQL
ncbi:MAG: recombinase RecT [Anaerovoracaceae bacterium]